MTIFLDIDGVLVPAAHWKKPELLEDGFPTFKREAIHALQTIIDLNTRVILTTSHRHSYTIEQWQSIFARRGLNFNYIDVVKSKVTKKNIAIESWFAENAKPETFIIIDDDTMLYALPQYLKDHLIVTSPLIGLTLELLNDYYRHNVKA